MGNQKNMNYTNWNPGCEPVCEEQVINVGCACEVEQDCGCNQAENACGARPRRSSKPPCGCTETDGAHVYFDACDGYKEVNVCSSCRQEENMGRVLDVNCTLQNVCPGRRSALGLTLYEVDDNGAEYARGFQAITVPAHNARCNQDITVDTVRFVLPEDLSLQNRRHFVVRTQQHYLDADGIWNNRCGQ